MKQPSLPDLIQNPSCMDDYDPNAMSVAQARLFIRQFLSPVLETELLPISDSLGRVLASDVESTCNVPNHNNSAMDGYAFKHADASSALTVVGTAFAGRPFTGEVGAGECIKIMTGAVVPACVDTVVMQEHVQSDGTEMRIEKCPPLGANIRLVGEDLKLGQSVLPKGHFMRPADIGLLASIGVAEIKVFRPLKVAFFSTGDELVPVGTPLKDGQIYDSNRYTIAGMLQSLGAVASDLGNIPDDPVLLESTLLKAASSHDVVITSGGVSVGDADYMKILLAKHGQVLFWKINMKPGRPLAYGKIGSAHYFGLPGNPVSAMVTFYQFVREALLIVMGQTPAPTPMFKVKCVTPIKKATGRTEFQRGILFEEDGEWKVKTTGQQGSGILSSMSQANCFVVLDEQTGNVSENSEVLVQLFYGAL